MIDVTAQQQRFTLINIYGPNPDSPSLFKKIIKHLKEVGNSDYIICGDFNLVLDPYIDCSNYKNINNPKSRELLLDYMETNDIIDPFRESNPQLKRYTWRRRNPLKQARLDFFSHLRVCKGAKIRYRYNQVPHLTQDTNGKVTNSQ